MKKPQGVATPASELSGGLRVIYEERFAALFSEGFGATEVSRFSLNPAWPSTSREFQIPGLEVGVAGQRKTLSVE